MLKKYIDVVENIQLILIKDHHHLIFSNEFFYLIKHHHVKVEHNHLKEEFLNVDKDVYNFHLLIQID